MPSRADDLLVGPRGRRLCYELVVALTDEPLRSVLWTAPRGGADPARVQQALEAAVASLDPESLRTVDPVVVATVLMTSVDAVRYWQEGDDEDLLLAEPAVGAELLPVARAVVQAPATAWLVEPMDAGGQYAVGWPEDAAAEPAPPILRGAESRLRRWRDDTAARELRARRERPADPRANWSGEWWSTPALAGLVVTTRGLAPSAAPGPPVPVGLSLVEDSMGWTAGRSWPVQLPGDARILELAGPLDWVALVERYPLDVTASRRHDWWRVSGWAGDWVIPDWAAVAADIDAVHLTLDGYLSTAGRALPVDVPGLGQARTLLSNWTPDGTWWLTDALTGLGEATDWRREHQDSPRWTPLSG